MHAIKTNALRLLSEANIPCEAFEYDVSDGRLDAVSCARKLGVPEEQMFKTLVAAAPGPVYRVFVVPGNASLDLKKAARAASVKSVEMIPQKQLAPLTGYVHGGCSPIGMKKLFPTFVEETALLFDVVYVSAGRIGASVAVDPEALVEFLHAKFADLIVSPSGPK